jgi:hypothetical protein
MVADSRGSRRFASDGQMIKTTILVVEQRPYVELRHEVFNML